MIVRKSHTLAADYEVVSREDEAVDRDAPDFEQRWEQYQDGAGEPPLKPGIKPALFTLRHLRAADRNRLTKFDGEPARLCFAACALALVKVDGLTDETGKPLKVTHQIDDTDLHALRVVSPDVMETLGQGLCVELGAMALRRLAPRPN